MITAIHCLLLPHLRRAAVALSSKALLLMCKWLAIMLGPLLMLFTRACLLPLLLLPLRLLVLLRLRPDWKA
jgi:hypothetical protein